MREGNTGQEQENSMPSQTNLLSNTGAVSWSGMEMLSQHWQKKKKNFPKTVLEEHNVNVIYADFLFLPAPTESNKNSSDMGKYQ